MQTPTIKTTIEIDSHLLHLAKQQALSEHSSLKEVVNRSLRHSLVSTSKPAKPPTIGGHKLDGFKTKLTRNDIYDHL